MYGWRYWCSSGQAGHTITDVESWIYWIIVDLIGIWRCFVKGVAFFGALYALLLRI